MLTYYRPYKKLGTHIKSHAILPEEWQTLKLNKGPFVRSLWTDYYDGKRIYSIIDNLDTPSSTSSTSSTNRTIWYREILSQTVSPVDLELERVTEHCLTLDPKTWVNHFPHDHIRQKLVYESALSLYSLEILFDKVKSKEQFFDTAENILSFSYVLKTKD